MKNLNYVVLSLFPVSYAIPVSASTQTEMKLIYLRLITIKFNSYYQRKGAAASCSVSAADADSHSAALCWAWEALMGWPWDSASLSLSKPVSRSCRAEILVLSERNLLQAPHGSHSSLSAPCQIHASLLLMSAVPWVLLVIRQVVAGFCWKNIISRHELSHWFFPSHHWYKSIFYIFIACTILLFFESLWQYFLFPPQWKKKKGHRTNVLLLVSHMPHTVPHPIHNATVLPTSTLILITAITSTSVIRWLVKRSYAKPISFIFFMNMRVSFFLPFPVFRVFFPVFVSLLIFK